MQLEKLDNAVLFKKAFTDKVVFKSFVKDIIGIDVDPEKIETEKRFGPKVGNVDFRFDIFAEDTAKRIIVEIQKLPYDHNFDRFLLYHMQAIAEQQRNSKNYTTKRTVYTIIVLTAPYLLNKKTGEFYDDEVMISSLNPRNLKGVERRIFNHELIFLNPNYKGEDTPGNYRDWLDLIYESIHSPENPHINREHPGIQRAVELIEYENLTGEEIRLAKIEVMKEETLQLREEDKAHRVAYKMILKGYSNEVIAEITELDIDLIELIRKNNPQN